MSDKDIDALFEKAGRSPGEVNSALTERIRASLGQSIQPVRPLPATWILAPVLAAIGAVVAIAGAARVGFWGFDDLAISARVLIGMTLALLLVFAALAFAGEMIPGSRRIVGSGVLVAGVSAVLLVLFGLLFRDYQTTYFVHTGLICLRTGLAHALPAALLAWLVLRRGFAVNPIGAGLVCGALAGLAGVGMLELHCNNFQALHVLVWHTAVVPVSAAIGAATGWLFRRR